MKKVIAVVGPTASGKSALGVFLAQKLGGEIISADSRQVYKGLNIGTGKITKKEMRGVRHHLLDVASPMRQFTADDFVKLGTKKLAHVERPLVVGGTGFYIDALLGRISLPSVPPNPKLRAQLEKKSIEELFKTLKKLDPARAKTIEPHHKRRLIRAIEIAYFTKRSRTSQSEGKTWPSGPERPSGRSSTQLEVLWLGLNPKDLDKRISKRLHERIKEGMVREARRLHTHGLSYKRMEELGLEYRYLARLLQNKLTKEEFFIELEREIRKYTKRQMRWFKRNKEIHWIKNKHEALQLARRHLN